MTADLCCCAFRSSTVEGAQSACGSVTDTPPETDLPKDAERSLRSWASTLSSPPTLAITPVCQLQFPNLCQLTSAPAFLPGTSDSAGSGYGWLSQKDSKGPGARSEQVAACELGHFREAYDDGCLSAKPRHVN